MFQTFLRSRAQTYLRSIVGEREFRARSPERDAETDRERLDAVMSAIDQALSSAEAEQAGLTRRVDDVLARAAVTFGNGDDEYLTRESLDSHHLDLFETEIQNGQRRIRDLTGTIAHYKALKDTFVSRFPEYKSAPKADA
ncbi:hypothetical protein [Tardiphaga sp.]|jgi:hypothetical protein|uniref:hypothetical protein n=1 Tax=Tardiphaga sp. TaxID=1926292 RepID=UPI0037D9C6D8